MIEIRNMVVYSTEDRIIHRLGTDIYFHSGKGTAAAGDSPASFEETDSIPPAPDHAYGEKVESLIRERYSLSEELAILRQRDSKPGEFAGYFAFAEECKARARREIKV